MTDADHVFILTLSDSEIDIVRRAAIMLGKTVTSRSSTSSSLM